jgi:pimeloyl-ACP methyl ester carboxylesterase
MKGEEMQITSRGYRISYTAVGDRQRPALLLVHGILQAAVRWAEMGYLDAFADDYRVIAVDLLGHGDSDKPTDPDAYTVDRQLQDLVAVLDAESAPACHVWGYSGGSALALALAATHPARTLSMIVGGIPPNLPRDAREAVFGPWIDALRAGDWDRFWATFLPIDEPTKAILQASNDHRSIAAWLGGAVATGELLDPGEVPTLVYMGDKELFLDDARQAARGIGATFEIIPGRGHSGAFQDLAAVEPITRSFLEQASRTALAV